ncbi:helix-turn-helix domain-containing protein [Microbulbifer epialgicus]|uniref:Helix-turn-helix domain-containing protein n=1 Tax=Microbulbifer epialgicus TaxID=393907 RepID=A0ABV4P791_9GAMM
MRRASHLRLKQHQVAEALGVSRSFVHKLYTGQKRGISFMQLYKLCSLLEMSPDELLGYPSTAPTLTESQVRELLSKIEASLRDA